MRIGKTSRWKADGEDAVASVAADLRPRPDEDLSVYRVDSIEEAQRVAAAHALTQREGPDKIDLVVLTDESWAGLLPAHRPNDDLPKYLSDRHFEVPGLDDPQLLERASAAAHGEFSAGRVHVERMRADRIANLYNEGLRDEPGIEDATRWKTLAKREDGER